MTILRKTGAVFAILHADAARHDDAVALVSRIARRVFGPPFVTDHVIEALYIRTRSRTNSSPLEQALGRFLPRPTPALRGWTAVSLGTTVLEPTWEEFRPYRDQRLSFTDASLMATRKELNLDRLATFDRQLARLVPHAE